jgi:hypothetical protein
MTKRDVDDTTAPPRPGITPARRPGGIGGPIKSRNAQLARRFLDAGHRLVEVEDYGAYSYGAGLPTVKSYHLHYRPLDGITDPIEYTFHARSFARLDSDTLDPVRLRHTLWRIRQVVEQDRRGLHRQHEDEERARDSYGGACARLMAWDLGDPRHYQHPAPPVGMERAGLLADLDRALVRFKRERSKTDAIKAEVRRLVGPEPPEAPRRDT